MNFRRTLIFRLRRRYARPAPITKVIRITVTDHQITRKEITR